MFFDLTSAIRSANPDVRSSLSATTGRRSTLSPGSDLKFFMNFKEYFTQETRRCPSAPTTDLIPQSSRWATQ